jgi:hypothetical protein
MIFYSSLSGLPSEVLISPDPNRIGDDEHEVIYDLLPGLSNLNQRVLIPSHSLGLPRNTFVPSFV